MDFWFAEAATHGRLNPGALNIFFPHVGAGPTAHREEGCKSQPT